MKTSNFTETHIITPSDQHIATKNLAVYYGDKQGLYSASLAFPKNSITALIGASGSGKSTFLRCLNRMNDTIARVEGEINYQGLNVNAPNINIYALRRQIGMVFQRPNPFAKTIRENLTFALKAYGQKDKAFLNQRVEASLKAAALWDEVKDKLDTSALALSGGQAQRVCLARTLAVEPDIILLDEPTSALDPISTAKIEKTLLRLKQKYTIIIVTHNMEQAERIADYTAFFHLGHVLEYDVTENIFHNPQIQTTQEYVSGNFG